MRENDILVFNERADQQKRNRKVSQNADKDVLFDVIDSTNAYAKSKLKDGERDDFLVVAREQTAGRGRFDRKFFSPKDAGVYFSLVITPKSDDEIAFYTPICAIATAAPCVRCATKTRLSSG